MEKQRFPKYDLTEENIRAAAINTILDIWSCIDWDRVDKKRILNIWDEVASKVGGAARTTSNYEKFVEKLSRSMDIRSLKYRSILEVQNQSKEFKDAVIRLIREQTLMIMLEVKSNNEIRKEESKIKREKEKELKENKKVIFNEKGAVLSE